MNSVCIYLGAAGGDSPIFEKAAARMGRLVAEKGLKLVFGGSDVGLMKTLADEALAAGGEVVGVTINHFYDRGICHDKLHETHVVEDMHIRKAMMRELADAFIALPGGLGTLDELLETLALGVLKIHDKPVGLLNLEGYYDPLLDMLARADERGFMHRPLGDHLVADDDPARLLARLEQVAR